MHFALYKKKLRAALMLVSGAAALIFSMAWMLRLYGESREAPPFLFPASPVITVLNEQSELCEVELERFLVGVLAGEMPVSFELEALKAQAIAARTYIMNAMDGQANAARHADAVVCCDSTHCQAFRTEDELRRQWGAEFDANYAKLCRAVSETYGEVLMYEGALIDALYFSTCGGKTTSAADYWSSELPYLQSVECGFCGHSPRFCNEQSLLLTDAARLLNCSVKNIPKELARLSARTVREKLSLFSADFSYEIKGENIIFVSRGSGHGVGLCQYGADGMARAGYVAADILRHYYTDIDIVCVYAQAD